jgi:hypothetical protein
MKTKEAIKKVKESIDGTAGRMHEKISLMHTKVKQHLKIADGFAKRMENIEKQL